MKYCGGIRDQEITILLKYGRHLAIDVSSQQVTFSMIGDEMPHTLHQYNQCTLGPNDECLPSRDKSNPIV